MEGFCWAAVATLGVLAQAQVCFCGACTQLQLLGRRFTLELPVSCAGSQQQAPSEHCSARPPTCGHDAASIQREEVEVAAPGVCEGDGAGHLRSASRS